jgi:HAD superfamily hydrolase (TIGR01484 family)
MKTLIVFDLDGTLAESKAAIDAEMAALLDRLLAVAKVAVISGGAWPQFQQQLLAQLAAGNDAAAGADAGAGAAAIARLDNLSLLPTCGTRFYQHDGAWKLLYAEDFTAAEKTKITASLKQASEPQQRDIGKTWGEVIEDRGSQITYSALGQEAPLEDKKKWDPDFAKRGKIKATLDTLIPEFAVALGGATSIDVTRQGIDKGYGIRKLRDVLHIGIEQMIFVGDALFPGGNDYPAKQAGAVSIEVREPHETKRVVEAIIACTEPPR